MTNFNSLRIAVHDSNDTRISDPGGDLLNVQSIRFSTGYPGGLYLSASMFVPRDIAKNWLVRGAQRLVIRNSHAVIFEGKIGDLDRALQRDTEGIRIDALGYWGAYLASRRLRRWYADSRTSENPWVLFTPLARLNIDITRYDDSGLNNLLHIVPQQGIDWANNDAMILRYTAPTGEEIRRIDFDYDFAEGSQQWTTKIRDVSNATDLFTLTADASDVGEFKEPASGCSILEVHLISNAAQTTPGDQSVYAEFSNITVYATMNHTPTLGKNVVTLTEIAKDIRAELTDLSADEFEIDSNTVALKPFIEDGFLTTAEILIEAAKFGDTSNNQWAVGVLASELSTDDKPLLFAEQYPVLTDYDYAVRVDEATLEPNFDISEGYIGSDENNVWNWIVVRYQDEQGFARFATPDDDANLKDTDSITDWGQRDYLLRIGESDANTAANYGRRFLLAHKDPVWHMTKPIKVRGSIRSEDGNPIPASEIVAGKRIRVENFLRDPATLTEDLIFLITKTSYDDNKEVCTITTGRPDSLDVILAQQSLEAAR